MKRSFYSSQTTEDIVCWKLVWRKDAFLCDRRGIFPILNVRYHVSRKLNAKEYYSAIQDILIGTSNDNSLSLEMLLAFTDECYALNMAASIQDCIISKCIIPKGTVVFQNDREILANTIIIFNPFIHLNWQINRIK